MLRPEIDWNICQVCDPCQVRLICKVRAIVKIDPDEPPYIDQARCNGCGNCVLECPHSAIMLKNGYASNLTYP
jgi:MinD superfamily P-loop ATPase